MHNSVSVRCSATVHLIAAVLLFASVGICLSSISPAFAEKKSELEEAIVSHGATHFVAVNGNDNGPGTADRPWATINHAAEQTEAGDTIVVRGGRYVLPAQVRLRKSGAVWRLDYFHWISW